ncbi:MAG: protease modulator HflC [Myxococcota bacterium]|jgi:modulator of FtsH protease HflC|nr:protease modulator HflC [Myxococcota bacterium]
MRLFFALLILVGSLAGVIWAGQFGVGPAVVVNEWEYKIPLLLGAPWRESLSEPGLTWRIPLVEEMVTIDKRLQFLDAEPVEMQIESERLAVDYYAVWRVVDPLLFRRSFPRLEEGAEPVIQRQLKSVVGAAVGRMSLLDLLARAELVGDLGDAVSGNLAAKGIEIVDVRINRTELPMEAKTAAYDQMREQRRAISREHRARGEREAREIQAKADREARTLLAQATSLAEITRGQGDAEASRIYAQAYGEDPEFYAFVRSLEAYRGTLSQNTTLVLSPEHPFLRYLDPEIRSR